MHYDRIAGREAVPSEKATRASAWNTMYALVHVHVRIPVHVYFELRMVVSFGVVSCTSCIFFTREDTSGRL